MAILRVTALQNSLKQSNILNLNYVWLVLTKYLDVKPSKQRIAINQELAKENLYKVKNSSSKRFR